jgi:hypothetical protein
VRMFAVVLQDLVDLVWIPVWLWHPPLAGTYVICASRRDQGSACSVAWPDLQTPSRSGWRLLGRTIRSLHQERTPTGTA